MIFEYVQRVVVDATLDVDNIGECAIQARNDLGEEYYLMIKTVLGWTEIIEYGPACPDISMLPHTVNYKYDRFEFNSAKIERLIDKFLNDGKRMISQAQVVEVDDIRDFIVSPLDKVFPYEPRLVEELLEDDEVEEGLSDEEGKADNS